MSSVEDFNSGFINHILEYAKTQLTESQYEVFSHFVTIFFSNLSAEDIEARNISDLYGVAFSQWNLMQYRQPDSLNIQIINPSYEEYGWQSTHTIIQVVTDDMPFLVDSMRIELNRLNLTTHLMIHCGGMQVRRDSNNKLVDIIVKQNGQVRSHYRREAPIHMEVDRQTDPEFLTQIKKHLTRVLNDVRVTVSDWQPMQERMREIIKGLDASNAQQHADEVRETKEFLQWMLDNHFTFLGCRDYEVVGEGDDIALKLIPNSGLGVLRDHATSKQLRFFSELPSKARKLALSSEQILIISKTNTISTVHRSAYTDYVGVKQFDSEGKLCGERRFIGLYTSEAYRGDPRTIPFIRHKVDSVLHRAGFPGKSHSAKDLLHILATLPRDDLFHAATDELYNLSIAILHLQERRQIRAFFRRDPYGRFISCLVYVPRENFNTDVVARMRDALQEAFHGLDITFNTRVTESVLARIHFVVRIDPHTPLVYDAKALEKKLVEIGESWFDGFRENALEYYGEERGNKLVEYYRNAFPAGYREAFYPRQAVYDVDHIEKLTNKCSLGMSFYRPIGAARDVIRFKLYHPNHTVPLSDAVPMLENMGLRVIGEQPYQINFSDGRQVWINDFSMTYALEPTFEVEDVKDIFQEAFYKIWMGEAENDPFNRLVLEAELNWREISVLRAYTKYFRQIGFTFSENYIAQTLVNNYQIAKLLIELFKSYFDPKRAESHALRIEEIEREIEKLLEDVAILDEDRILRRYLHLIHATLRTNYFQKNAEGGTKSYIAFKLDPKKIPELPLPLPRCEIFVYSPRFEGVHLRAARVARGGIRWSDRPEDFRTEVLGLMKAQQVKNAIIIPAGAKGGFVPKCLPLDGSRELIIKEGIACYKNFISGLMDLTDNIVDGTVVVPDDTVCFDDQDPYIVVAADKGTATFSDIANSLAKERNYWLGDAFASGGSTGYDHKKMGITARGAWVSAERHFQELGINLSQAEISVIGIGDMSGDVFGNGMLMTPHLKLVAAFNHMHIFLDPNPDPAVSFAERKRLFELPRSTWDDYDRALISKGGGVYSRFAKAVRLSDEIKELLNIEEDYLVPSDLIKAILRAPVDMLWNGGIGTYVKASYERNEDVGDRNNDAVRISGKELRAKVVCEGGNLGLTQLGRIEFELNGGKINTDFIDNSAGVDCSDHEVNIKILLNSVVNEGDLTAKQRNDLLVTMTDEVAALVLQNNYHQVQAISIAAFSSNKDVGLYMRYLNEQEYADKIDRELEFLPTDKILLQRRSMGKGLTRPELSIMFAYSKIILKSQIKRCEILSDEDLVHVVGYAFPTVLRKQYAEQMCQHYLARDIISTQLSNRIISEMGITFIYRLRDEMGASVMDIVKAYVIVTRIFKVDEFYADIESLDYQVSTDVQYQLMQEAIRLVRRATRWFLRNRRESLVISSIVDEFAGHVANVAKRLPKLLLGVDKDNLVASMDSLIEKNVPPDIALKVACAGPLYHALNIVEAANMYEAEAFRVAKIYFMLVDRMNLLWFRDQINTFPVTNRWSVLAKAAYKGDLDWIQRALTVGVLLDSQAKSIPGKINAWFARYEKQIKRWQSIITEMRSAESNEFAILFVALRELLDLAQASTSSSLTSSSVLRIDSNKSQRE